MLPYFKNEKQKNECLNAISDSIAMWDYIAKSGCRKRNALFRLEMQGKFKKNTSSNLKNECFLCEYVQKQYPHKCDTYAGLNCEDYCPVIWCYDNPSNLDDPLNLDEADAPCGRIGSPYQKYNNGYKLDEQEIRKAAKNMVQILKESLEDARQIPVCAPK